MNETIEGVARQRETECRRESWAVEKRLRVLSRYNWVTVVLPALIFSAAGAEIIAGVENPTLHRWTGGFTLAASLAVLIHKARDCDAHQAELNRLRKEYDKLAVKYRSVYQISGPDPDAKISPLDESLAELKGSADVVLPRKLRHQASKALKN
jgi:hypothetical protein